MEFRQLLANLERDGGGANTVERVLVVQHRAQVAAFDILHGDEEITVQIACLVDFDHPRIEPVQFHLDGGAAALRLHHQARMRIAARPD